MWLRHFPLRVFFIDFESFGEVGGAYPSGKHLNTLTVLQEILLFDALEWRSKVEFRPGRRPSPVPLPQKVVVVGFYCCISR